MLFIFNLIVQLRTEDFILTKRGGEYIELILSYGQWIIALFSSIFLIYMTKAIVKNCYKEFGLLYSLGMDKKSLRGILFIQNIILSICSLLLGSFLSILLSPLFVNLVGKMLNIERIGLEFEVDNIKLGLIIFALIFVLVTIISLNSIRKTNPIELSQLAKKGEKEPKMSVISFLLSLIFIGVGYWISLNIGGALDAIPKFFPAVVLVIFGTVLFFRSVVISILKALRKNKKFYYKGVNMTFIGELIKRSKESAMALSTITIISSMLLISFVVMVAMFVGKNDFLARVAPRDYQVGYTDKTLENDVDRLVENVSKKLDIDIKNQGHARRLIKLARRDDNGKIHLLKEDDFKNIMMDKNVLILSLVDINSFNEANKTNFSLNDKESLVFDYKNNPFDKISIEGIDFRIKQKLEKIDNILLDPTTSLFNNLLVVVNDTDKFEDQIEDKMAGKNIESLKNNIKYFDIGEKNSKIIDNFTENLDQAIANDEKLKDGVEINPSIESSIFFNQMHQGAYVTIVLLVLTFLISAVVVIYYKQASEGLEDGRNIKILKKIGMANTEIKKSVARQNYVTFFAPLLLAIIHTAVASKLVYGMLKIFSMLELKLFIEIEVVCILIFALIYFLIFRLTLPIYFEMGKLNKE